ncbi:MAG TPA: WcbI family polysaccharide biosynthesis putative acetyltransferase, partial [Solirubrobacteraceae bacterium]|nr:WcbI family polysaccharide biosynthesis putative acetyltransferase [Solirubrobacteraceae bacterium]
MERAVVIGNCQASALELMLDTSEAFRKRFELVRFPPVHEFPEELVPKLHEAVADAAVVIPQRVDDSYRGGIGLGTKTLAALAGDATV